MVRFRVLGGVAAYDERGEIPLGSARQRSVLAVLLVEPGVPVSADRLVDRVWGTAAPRRARETLHSYVSRLRSALGDGVLARRAGSYLLQVEALAVDVHRFRSLVARARAAGEGDGAVELWREAMGLWRGEVLADLDSEWLRQVAVAWESERAAAVRDFTDVRLRRGEHAELLPELSAAVGASPLDERVAGQLMVALYRCGRQAEALARYRTLRDRLVSELGSDPSLEVRELHQRILEHDPQLAVEFAGSRQPLAPLAAPAEPVSKPAQLPADVAGFTGRAEDLRRLDALLGAGRERAVVITAIGGTAGVGKTALATHWAHRVSGQFPDGQLYVNLRGYDAAQPMAPGDALARFLTALGVTGQEVPLAMDERAARFRSEVAGRRMLIVLDNAGSVAQVRPLLPGSGSCVVVVTSRDSLAGLVAVDGAHRIDLDLLARDEAIDLLRGLVGGRVETEPEAAAALAEQCVRLPLALRVAAELAVSRPDEPLVDLVAELADRQRRLELLDAGDDPHAAVRMVFSWSLQQLPSDAAGMFRLLGLHPGPDFDPYAAAALAGVGVDAARRTLERLVRASLVHRIGRGRYGMHDLLRAYATGLATTEESAQRRQEAEDRLLDFYQVAAVSAMDARHPAEAHYRPEVPTCATTIPDLSDPDRAYDWLETERFCLMAVAAHAAARDRAGYVVGLTRILHRHLSDTHITDLLAMNDHGYRAAERAGDAVGEAHVLRHLAVAYNALSRYDEAIEHGQQALFRFRRAGDLVGEGLTLTVMGITRYREGSHKQAIEDHRQALVVLRRAGDRLGEGFALNNLAVVNERVGRYEEAAGHHRVALVIFAELGSVFCEALGLGNLANVELRQGQYAAARAHVQRSLDLYDQLRRPISAAHVWDTLGILHLHLGEPEAAARSFAQALSRYHGTGYNNGEAWSKNGLGEAAILAGRPADAIAYHTEALELAAVSNSRHQEARALADLGHAHRALGDPDQARAHYERAYAIYTELDMPDAEDLLACLNLLAGNPTPAMPSPRADVLRFSVGGRPWRCWRV